MTKIVENEISLGDALDELKNTDYKKLIKQEFGALINIVSQGLSTEIKAMINSRPITSQEEIYLEELSLYDPYELNNHIRLYTQLIDDAYYELMFKADGFRELLQRLILNPQHTT
jgi:hypothetical protein